MKFFVARIAIALSMLFVIENVHSRELREVSLIQLITHPTEFDGQDVRAIGFLHLEFEGNAVYLHREDFEYSNLKNAVAITLSATQLRAWSKLNNRFVIVEGKFDSSSSGHLNAMSGSFRVISRLDSWPARATRSKN